MLLTRYFLATLSWIAAGALVVAAMLKTSATYTEVYHFGFLFEESGLAQVAAICGIAIGEIALALWLLNFPACRQVWLIAGVVFFVLFAVSLSEAFAGKQSCDCFGAVIVRPYYTTSLDLSLALLCLFSVYLLRQGTYFVNGRRLLTTGLMSLVIFITGLALLYVREASSFAVTTGMPTIVASLRLDDTGANNHHPLQGNLLFAARGRGPVRIVGWERNCSLKLKTSFPLTVEANDVARVPIILSPPTDRPIDVVPTTILIDDPAGLRKVTMNLRVNEGVL